MSSSWYDLTAEIGAIAFVIAVFYLLSLSKQARFSRRAWPAWVVIAVFLSALLWSMWSETLRPLVQAGEYIQAIRTAIGLALIVLSMLLLTYGGFRVVVQVMGLTGTEIFEICGQGRGAIRTRGRARHGWRTRVSFSALHVPAVCGWRWGLCC